MHSKALHLQVCTTLYKSVQNCTSLYKHAVTEECMQGANITVLHLQVCTTMYKSVQQCTSLYNIVQVYNNLQVCTTLYKSVQHCTSLYNIVQVCTSMYKYVQGVPKKKAFLCSKAPRGLKKLTTDEIWVSFEKFRKFPV